MPKIELEGSAITVELTADSDVTDGDVVGAVGPNSVAPIDDTAAQSVVGVADETVSAGNIVEVAIMGKKTVIADGPVSVGEPVRAASVSGRCVSEATVPASHTHSMGTHNHTALQSDGTDTTVGAHQAMTDGGGAGTTIQVGVDASGQAAESVPTSSDNPGDTNGTDSAPEHGRTFGKALSESAAAGDEITVLVSMTA